MAGMNGANKPRKLQYWQATDLKHVWIDVETGLPLASFKDKEAAIEYGKRNGWSG